ncbi:MAG: NAD(P)H-dependent oxidoreductase [Acidovorax sp.]|uniref:NAD(P)H-dependent oxidoreductase n=1 Tax=Acidovorax sp. TaxID=1872122 RepID=UPI0026394268|nr:NAD(P)H-dependent oxidoreductase [Acidovorax sp.]MDH4428257.1 NAD(P)H-dependent oxidoreductase [Acidovorax sp.]MDH4446527.1 NAD(P)H-dependent oxidoreductase [Acidovorax sp.]
MAEQHNILVILGHPASDSLCAGMARAYAEGAQNAGAQVRFLEVGQLAFDAVLRAGYRGEQSLEPDLLAAREDITWAHHLVWVYPIWWGAMPALLKGFIDRVFLPGFAFRYRKGSSLWDRLLAGRSAELLVTMDSPPWYFRWVTRMPGHHQMKKAILEFCGIRPVRIHSFGPVRSASADRLAQWVDKARQLGQRQGMRTA